MDIAPGFSRPGVPACPEGSAQLCRVWGASLAVPSVLGGSPLGFSCTNLLGWLHCWDVASHPSTPFQEPPLRLGLRSQRVWASWGGGAVVCLWLDASPSFDVVIALQGCATGSSGTRYGWSRIEIYPREISELLAGWPEVLACSPELLAVTSILAFVTSICCASRLQSPGFSFLAPRSPPVPTSPRARPCPPPASCPCALQACLALQHVTAISHLHANPRLHRWPTAASDPGPIRRSSLFPCSCGHIEHFEVR